eukprot:TRINITY_DN70261_c0_g1_i1.p1 TRINITY_DN70261_c0_g1~~TRINITY_DN70261_c0_g1_i1.p1  ORF type:complete len:429 (+),score=70.96 TRINITY_DN70261_c0_g1_i1:183-1289(+)
MGYCHGNWEFCASTSKILKDVAELTRGQGVGALDCSYWKVSDDTVEHLATAEGLASGIASCQGATTAERLNAIMTGIARETKKCAKDFTARAPGKTEQRGIKLLQEDGSNWTAKPFDSLALGCGAAMRTACIGLVFWRPTDVSGLVTVSTETSRLTKTHPTGYLGGVCAAVFTAFALQGVPVREWGARFLQEILPQVQLYVTADGQRHIKENQAALLEGCFERKWRWYLQKREIENGSEPHFPDNYGPQERDAFYAECAKMAGVNPSGKNPGSKSYDAVLIAYDALLWVESKLPEEPASLKWTELCYRAVLHRGDNDSTGSIAAAWYGALHGFDGVPAKHRGVEYQGRCNGAGLALHKAALRLDTLVQ